MAFKEYFLLYLSHLGCIRGGKSGFISMYNMPKKSGPVLYSELLRQKILVLDTPQFFSAVNPIKFSV